MRCRARQAGLQSSAGGLPSAGGAPMGGAPNGATGSAGSAGHSASSGSGGSNSSAAQQGRQLCRRAYCETSWATRAFRTAFGGPRQPAKADRSRAAGAGAGIDRKFGLGNSFLSESPRTGGLVFERYGFHSGQNPARSEQAAAPRSCPVSGRLQFSTTKSFLSALVGVALAEGALSGLKVHAADSFPDYAALDPSAGQVLDHARGPAHQRSGLDFIEGDQTTFDTPDPARAMLSRKVVDKPVGTVWNYSSGGANIISEMLRVATRQDAARVRESEAVRSDRHRLAPMGRWAKWYELRRLWPLAHCPRNGSLRRAISQFRPMAGPCRHSQRVDR